jgi:hypothetical protein
MSLVVSFAPYYLFIYFLQRKSASKIVFMVSFILWHPRFSTQYYFLFFMEGNLPSSSFSRNPLACYAQCGFHHNIFLFCFFLFFLFHFSEMVFCLFNTLQILGLVTTLVKSLKEHGYNSITIVVVENVEVIKIVNSFLLVVSFSHQPIL